MSDAAQFWYVTAKNKCKDFIEAKKKFEYFIAELRILSSYNKWLNLEGKKHKNENDPGQK